MMKKFFVLAAVLALPGCISLLPKPGAAPSVFTMEAPDAPSQIAQTADWTIAVARPMMPRMIAGGDLVLREGDNQIAFIGGAQWAEPASSLLQRTLTTALNRSGKIVAATPESGVRADCELHWDVYAFDARQGADGFSARFEASARLVGRNRGIQQSTRIATTGKANGGTVRAAAAALTDAALKGLDQAGAWALQQQCEKSLPQRVRPLLETPLAGGPITSAIPAPRRSQNGER
jgi:cholesterol transport system auxiliary component